MKKSFLELVVGSLDEKRKYRQTMKRVEALPDDYRKAFKKIKNYIYNSGAIISDIDIFDEIITLFEESVVNGRELIEVVGYDAAYFCDELIKASYHSTPMTREKLNQDILNYFHKEESQK